MFERDKHSERPFPYLDFSKLKDTLAAGRVGMYDKASQLEYELGRLANQLATTLGADTMRIDFLVELWSEISELKPAEFQRLKNVLRSNHQDEVLLFLQIDALRGGFLYISASQYDRDDAFMPLPPVRTFIRFIRLLSLTGSLIEFPNGDDFVKSMKLGRPARLLPEIDFSVLIRMNSVVRHTLNGGLPEARDYLQRLKAENRLKETQIDKIVRILKKEGLWESEKPKNDAQDVTTVPLDISRLVDDENTEYTTFAQLLADEPDTQDSATS